MEQHSRRTCLKFSLILKVGTSENTDSNNICHQPGITQEIIQTWAGPDRENPSSQAAQE